MAATNEKKGLHLSVSSGGVALGLTALGAILFFMSYTTGYYIFGQMKSGVITAFIAAAFICEAMLFFFSMKASRGMFAKLLPFFVTALLAASAMLIVGDRVEGIGNCIVSDYDSGHGGEEAIYMSLVGAVCLLTAMIYNIIGAFSENGSAPAGKNKTLGMIFSGTGIGLAAVIATVMLAGGSGSSGVSSGGSGKGTGDGPSVSGTFTISFNQANNNIDADNMPDFQFLSANMGGLCRADARFYVDIVLDLDGAGSYALTSDAYVVDSGKRAEVGDPSGLGLVYRTTSEGSYTDNGDGTVTTSAASHVKFELKTDSYSEQMKSMMHIDIDGSDADGEYDSDDYPVLLDYVPGAVFTLSDGTIADYSKPGLAGEFTIAFNQANGNTDADVMPAHQFLSADLGGLCRADARFYIDLVLNLDGAGGYTLVSDAYVIDSGKRAEIGDPSGLGLVCKTTSEGSYTDNGDGTVTTARADHVVFELKTDTYSEQMKSMMHVDLDGSDADGEYDSADYPVLLDYVPETIWTLDEAAGAVTTYEGTEEEEGSEEAEGGEEAVKPAEALTVASADGATTMTFNPDGTYVFAFEAYGISDPGSWTYDGAKLVVT
nr:hypothetical protein [Lachnospiraceae bacterium]